MCRRCGGRLITRSDDGETAMAERLMVYERDTRPLVDFYRVRPTFRSINGAQPPDLVAADLAAAVDSAVTGPSARGRPERDAGMRPA